MKHLFQFSETVFAAFVFVTALQNSATTSVNAQYFKTVDEAHNPGEEHRYFDIVMKPYPIPAETTTYVDFMFNLPDDLPDFFHVTYGEIINSQPEHLHHAVLIGCNVKVDADKESLPIDSDELGTDCMTSVGGWAPGADIFGNTDLDTGILMGRGFGVQSLRLNVHYTDGVYVGDESEKILKMATDGIRVHYTPVFRPYSSIAKPLINVPTAPTKLSVPPGESRFFVSRTCTVDTNCKDASAETIGFLMAVMGMDNIMGNTEASCEMFQSACTLGGTHGSYTQRLCPKTCGLCEPGPNGETNPFDPDTYRATAVSYHAHLLGREMYTTLVRREEADSPTIEESSSTVVIPKPAPLATQDLQSREFWIFDEESSSTVVIPKAPPLATQDLQSREFWIFDNQEVIPLEYDVFRDDTILRGTEIRAGDKIQSTCVFDSTYRTDPTYFFLSSYDEMCMNSIFVTFETPASLLEENNGGGGVEEEDATTVAAAAAVDIAVQLHLLSFNCLDDAGVGDVYSGILGPDEDGRDIWRDHPVESAEGCTFPTNDFFFTALTTETRNCREGVDVPANLVCGGGDDNEGLFLFDVEAIAGATCKGGSFDGKDANEGVTEADCLAGGGTNYDTYTCGRANDWLILEATLDPATVDGSHYGWWKSKCCYNNSDDEAAAEDKPSVPKETTAESEEESPSAFESSAADGPRGIKIVLPAISAVVVAAMAAMF